MSFKEILSTYEKTVLGIVKNPSTDKALPTEFSVVNSVLINKVVKRIILLSTEKNEIYNKTESGLYTNCDLLTLANIYPYYAIWTYATLGQFSVPVKYTKLQAEMRVRTKENTKGTLKSKILLLASFN